jgi:hypothetical protein
MKTNLPPGAKRKKRSGQKFLFAAAVLNAVAFGLGLWLTSLQGQLDELQANEFYFMRNDLAIMGETTKRTLIHAHLNELKMLRRVAAERLSAEERKLLVADERVFQRMIGGSLRIVAAATHLQATDPPAGKGPDDLFRPMTEDQIVSMMPKLQNDAWEFAKKLKLDMISLRKRIGYWKQINSAALVLSNLFLLWGGFLIFKVEGVELEK